MNFRFSKIATDEWKICCKCVEETESDYHEREVIAENANRLMD